MKDKGNQSDWSGKKGDEKISRKRAIKKVCYAAFSAATMMLLLNDPAKAQSDSPVLPPDWGDGDGWG
jgi:hypothetical protein